MTPVATARPIALTIGVFDGLHRGHQAVISAAVESARAREGAAWVATFDPHPDTIVRGSEPRPWITPPEERAALLHDLGVDRVIVVKFDRAMQALSPEEFLDSVLGASAPLACLVVGHDFRMGRGRVGDRAYLEAVGMQRCFAVLEVPFLMGEGAGKLSSTALRRAIEAGDLETATAMMGRRYALEGPVGSGSGRGVKLGYPTANLELYREKLLPAAGIYLSENMVEGAMWHGLTYVGRAGTFGPGPMRVEAHLLDFAGSLRGKRLSTHLIRRVRPDRAFESAESLVRAMDEDLAAARSFWAEGATPPQGV
jgi:riboflavin kinase / FMN adenylyltransferase